MQAVSSELAQLSQKTVLGSLKHRTKLPNTSLNHEKVVALGHVSLRNVLPLSLPDSSTSKWYPSASVCASVCASICASTAAGKGKDFSSKALSRLYFHTKRHVHQLRWHF